MLLLLCEFVDPKRVAEARDNMAVRSVLTGQTLRQGEPVTRELADLPAGSDVPKAHRFVAAGADDLCAVAAERCQSHEVFVPRQRLHLENTPDSELYPWEPVGIPSPTPREPPFIPSARACTLESLTRPESKNAFSAVLSTEGRVVGLWWEHLKPKEPEGPRHSSAPSACAPVEFKALLIQNVSTTNTTAFTPLETQSNSMLHQVHAWLLTRAVPDPQGRVVTPANDAPARKRRTTPSPYGHVWSSVRICSPPTFIYLYLIVGSWKMSVFPVRLLVPERPDRILSELAEILSGLSKPDFRQHHVLKEES